MGDAECLCGSCVRFLYGDLHSKVGHESVTRLPVGHYHARVLGEFNRRGLGWFVAGGWFRCNEFQLNFSTKTFSSQAKVLQCIGVSRVPRPGSQRRADSKRRPVVHVPVPSRPRRGFSQTSLEKLTVVELKKMCKERTVKMPENEETDGFKPTDSW